MRRRYVGCRGHRLRKSREQASRENDEIEIRTMLRLTEVLDHRVVDGAQFGKFARGIR
ncbi:MAG: hypothetical protein HOI35_08015 [Woeseia sp.]|nr:hypothetical protein [Woeseia sp.]MBT6209948.1 hypothetical protein [Woeseia sp.]